MNVTPHEGPLEELDLMVEISSRCARLLDRFLGQFLHPGADLRACHERLVAGTQTVFNAFDETKGLTAKGRWSSKTDFHLEFFDADGKRVGLREREPEMADGTSASKRRMN